jgi:hypothetical protein
MEGSERVLHSFARDRRKDQDLTRLLMLDAATIGSNLLQSFFFSSANDNAFGLTGLANPLVKL